MAYDVNIERPGINAVIDLQGNADAIAKHVGAGLPPFPGQANTATEQDGLSLYWIAVDRWLLRSSLDNEERLLAMTRPDAAPEAISIVQVSDTQQYFSITGPDADDIISMASSIDHHPSAFPQNGVSYTDIFGIKGLLIRIDNGFEVAVEASFADMIEDYLTRANA